MAGNLTRFDPINELMRFDPQVRIGLARSRVSTAAWKAKAGRASARWIAS